MRFVKLNPQFSTGNRSKYRNYDPSAMTKAYVAVLDEKMPVRKAAQRYGVPFQTLRDRVSGDINPECCTMGKDPLLSLEEESRMVSHLQEMATLGYGYNRQETIDIATDYVILLGKRMRQDKPLTLNWFYGFMKRWPDLHLVKPRALEVARAKAANLSNITKYFEELEKTLNKYDLQNKPHLIYNVDEKGLTLNHSPPRVVCGVETAPQEVTSGKSETVTVIGCASDIGNDVPPFFIFTGKRMNSDLLQGSTPGTVGRVSETGWSNSEIFLDFLAKHFVKYIPFNQHVLLLLDGHRSHVTLTVIEWAKQHNIIIQVMPSHTSHILQPLDVGCFGPLQNIYNNLCHKVIRTKSPAITKFDVCNLACKAYSSALTNTNIHSSFQKCGIYPFNKDIIKDLPIKPIFG